MSQIFPETLNGTSESRRTVKSTEVSNRGVLLRMGFSKDRVEKALTATGDVSVAGAIDWILSHKDDPFLDAPDQREYLVYLVPSGALLERIQDFLQTVKEIAGHNGAHLHMPHITMCHAFKTDSENIPAILQVMEEVSRHVLPRLPEKIKLERYTSESFMGLFLDKDSDTALKEYGEMMATSLQRFSGKPIPFKADKAFHLTLAYHFDALHYQAIHDLAKKIPLKSTCQWQFLLLSRDARFHSHEVYRMAHPWGISSHHDEELPYHAGDYVYVPAKPTHAGAGWLSGVSWSTGCTGLVPLTGLEKTFSSDVWILHGSIPYGSTQIKKLPQKGHDSEAEVLLDIYPPAQRFRWVLPVTASKRIPVAETYARKLNTYNVPPEIPWAKAIDQLDQKPTGKSSTAFVMRHGERMDFVFGVDWIHKCFDHSGNFTRTDLNMPKTVPKRRAGPTAYIRDPPLTAMGVIQAQLTGRAMKEAGVVFSRVFVSPALRSIQTATAVLEAYSDDFEKVPKLCVEPGLYEWFGWVREAHPDWLTPTELHAFGLPVDLDYQAQFSTRQLDFDEDVEGFYGRNGIVVRRILERSHGTGGNYLFVAHASSLDTCTRQLVGGTARSHFDMIRVTQRVPYCAVVACEQNSDDGSGWILTNPPFPTLTHGSNIKFNAIQTFAKQESFDEEHLANGTSGKGSVGRRGVAGVGSKQK